jgi:hypothetical protein
MILRWRKFAPPKAGGTVASKHAKLSFPAKESATKASTVTAKYNMDDGQDGRDCRGW